MTTEVILKKSSNPRKKYDAVIDGKKTVSFGANGYSDFTKHKDEERKKNYMDRHRKNEDWKDHKTAGFYAKHIFWNKPTIEASVKGTNKKFPKFEHKTEILI